MNNRDTFTQNVIVERQLANKCRIGELLSERGLITPQQLHAAVEHQRDIAPDKHLSQILVDMEVITPQQVAEVIAESIGIPYTVITADMVQPDALACLPRAWIEEHNLLPLSYVEDWLTIATDQFTNVFLIEDISRRCGCQVQVIAADADNIRQVRHTLFPDADKAAPSAHHARKAGLHEFFDDLSMGEVKVVEREEKADKADLMATASDSPVVKLVNRVIYHAVESRASDIHIEPDDETFRVRYRVDGTLMDAIRPQHHLLPAVVSRLKIMAGMDISERRLPQDGNITVTLDERPIDLRVSTMATKLGEKVVMRIVDPNAGISRLDSLGFEDDMLAMFRAAIRDAHGIVLVTGPTGSGKTTTLYSALAELVSDDHNISTVEDPVERRLPGTNQFQVHTKAGFTFAGALRSLLRQDPDIIMVGEIRDTETARLATEAALTGHLVLSTLHTNDAPTAVPRLVNMGVEPYLVAAALRAVLAQRLVRRICPHCRTESPLDAVQRETMRQLCRGEQSIDTACIGTGCARCHGTGYAGRVGVFELLLLNEEMLSRLTRDVSISALRKIMVQQNVTTLLGDGLNKLRQGLISIDGLLNIVSRTDDPDTLTLD